MFKNTKLPLFAISCVAIGSVCLSAQQQPDKTKPDNTGVNKQDRSNGGLTADQAKDNRSDREITQKIRQKVVGDKGLSTYGHNIKIICQHGKVTLKGPVHSEAEKSNIEEKAREVAGRDSVSSEITVKGDKSGPGHLPL
jgi:hyperosmotically inducible protein